MTDGIDFKLDPNKLAIEFVQANLDRIMALAGSGLKVAKNVVRARVSTTYRDYLTSLLKRHSSAKSFFIRDEPTPLYEFFVPLDLSTRRRRVPRATIQDLVAISPRMVVSGSAGCGKSILMRHLLVGCVRGGDKTPVFVELRQMNRSDSTLRAAMAASMRGFGFDLDDDYLELALKAGHFCALLDGFDELELATRAAVAAEIRDLSAQYPANWFVVSSRPDTDLNQLQDFVQFQIEPLDLESAADLVAKLPADEEVKSGFARDLRGHLFAEHQSFLSNPLLLSIMFLTYADIAHIPDKISLFYAQAYESLFQKHDALKGNLRRELRTNLDILDFGNAFAGFCVQSYDKRDFDFSRSDALAYFEHGKSLFQPNLQYDSSDLLADAMQAVCLLVEDGLEIVFAHRSFQEYFTAKFIAGCEPAQQARLIRKYANDVNSDSVMDLLFEIDRSAVEKFYVLTAIDDLQRVTGFHTKIGVTHLLKYFKHTYRSFLAHNDEPHGVSAIISRGQITTAIHFMTRHYPDEFPHAGGDDWDAARSLLIEEAEGSDELPTADLTTKSRFFGSLASGESSWSTAGLQRVVRLGEEIRKRHAQMDASLLQILSD